MRDSDLFGIVYHVILPNHSLTYARRGNFEEIQQDYFIYGLRNEEWVNFEKEIEYEAFLAKRKKTAKFAL